MNSPSLTWFLSVAPPVTSCITFLAPYQTVNKIRAAQSTGELPALTFVSLAVMCAIWATYGGLRTDLTILVPNVLGCVVAMYYLRVFEENTPKGARAVELLRCYRAGILLLLLLFAFVLFSDPYTSMRAVGTCGAVLSVVFSSSPLAALPAVWRDRSPDSIPLPTAVMLFANSLLWGAYGYVVVDDSSVFVPNAVGSVVAGIQLCVHLAFALGAVKSKGLGVRVASL